MVPPLSPQRRRAWHNINKLKEHLDTFQSDYTICFEAFHDLDCFFFGGDLERKIYMVATSADHLERFWGQAFPAGTDAPRVTIQLNSSEANATDPSSLREVLITLLHEMVHAYFYVKCGNDAPANRDHGHAPAFQRVLRAIQTIFDVEWRGMAFNQFDDYVLSSMHLIGPDEPHFECLS